MQRSGDAPSMTTQHGRIAWDASHSLARGKDPDIRRGAAQTQKSRGERVKGPHSRLYCSISVPTRVEVEVVSTVLVITPDDLAVVIDPHRHGADARREVDGRVSAIFKR